MDATAAATVTAVAVAESNICCIIWHRAADSNRRLIVYCSTTICVYHSPVPPLLATPALLCVVAYTAHKLPHTRTGTRVYAKNTKNRHTHLLGTIFHIQYEHPTGNLCVAFAIRYCGDAHETLFHVYVGVWRMCRCEQGSFYWVFYVYKGADETTLADDYVWKYKHKCCCYCRWTLTAGELCILVCMCSIPFHRRCHARCKCTKSRTWSTVHVVVRWIFFLLLFVSLICEIHDTALDTVRWHAIERSMNWCVSNTRHIATGSGTYRDRVRWIFQIPTNAQCTWHTIPKRNYRTWRTQCIHTSTWA